MRAPATGGQLPQWPAGNGEMPTRIRTFDWAHTPLGPVEIWPQVLRTSVDLTLASPVAAVLLWGPEHIQIYNDLWATQHAGKHPDALGQGTHECFAELADVLEPVYRRVWVGEGVTLEDALLPVLRHGSKQDAWWNVTYTPIRGASGVVEGIFCTLIETTAKVAAARALQASEEKYRVMFETMDQGYAEIEIIRDAAGRAVDHRMTLANPSFERQTGIPLEMAQGCPAREVLPDIDPWWTETFDKTAREGKPIRFEREFANTRRWFDLNLITRDKDHLQVWFDDITKRKHAEAVLRENEEQQTFLLKLSDTIRVLNDPDAIATTVTRMVANYFRVDRCFISRLSKEQGKAWIEHERRRPGLVSAEGQVNLADFPDVMRIAETKTMVFPDVQADPGLSARDKAAVAGLGLGAFIAAVLRHGERNYIWDLVIATVKPRVWSLTEPALLEEIAERTWLAIARARAERMLLETEKLAAVGRLASSIAHEINNPLEAITNLHYLMENTALPADAAQFLKQAQAELMRVSQITVQTLRFSRQNKNAAAVRLSELIESVVRLYEGKLKNARVAVEGRYRYNSALVCVPNELRQVVANLIGNAMDSMIGLDHSRICLRVRDAHSPQTGMNGIRLTVADTGTGMSSAMLSRIWEPFFTTKGATGTGLGLWVTEQIIRKHGGSVSVRSSTNRHNHGTVFSIFLPHVQDGLQEATNNRERQVAS